MASSLAGSIPRFFFETEAKELPHRLIKKKRIAQLINGKPGKNRYNKGTDTCRQHPKHEIPRPPLHTNKLHDHLFTQTNTPLNTLQPKTPDTWINTSQIHPTENTVAQKSNSSTKPPGHSIPKR
jgi:hypothetical protein